MKSIWDWLCLFNFLFIAIAGFMQFKNKAKIMWSALAFLLIIIFIHDIGHGSSTAGSGFTNGGFTDTRD